MQKLNRSLTKRQIRSVNFIARAVSQMWILNSIVSKIESDLDYCYCSYVLKSNRRPASLL